MDKIKTFPLQFTESYLNEIGECAKKLKISKVAFIMEAIEEKKKRVEKEKK